MPNPWNTTQQPKRNEPERFLQCRRPSLILGSGGSPGEGNGNSLQYSCLENSMDRGAWWATIHGVAKSWTWLSDFHSESFPGNLVVKNAMSLAMHGTPVRSLVQEDSTYLGATKPVCHDYWAWVPQPLKPTWLNPVLHNRSRCNEKPTHNKG